VVWLVVVVGETGPGSGEVATDESGDR
jgi:hypothetical protein